MQSFLLFDRTEQIDTIFASLLSLNVRVRQNWVVAATLYYAPRIVGFWIWLVATISLGFIWMSIETVESGRIFAQQLTEGYQSIDVHTASSETIEEMESDAYAVSIETLISTEIENYLAPTIEQCAELEATISEVFAAKDLEPTEIDLGVWGKSSKGRKHRRTVDLQILS